MIINTYLCAPKLIHVIPTLYLALIKPGDIRNAL